MPPASSSYSYLFRDPDGTSTKTITSFTEAGCGTGEHIDLCLDSDSDRIASRPSSTEMLFALGLGDQVVAVTHDCDWPAEAIAVPHLTRTVIPDGLSAAEIDRTVRETVDNGQPLYELDAGRLAELEPDLIVTQAVCDVCAVSYEDVVAVAASLPGKPRVLSLDPMRLDEVIADYGRLGDAASAEPEARLLQEQARRRLEAVSAAVEALPLRVLALEFDPPSVGTGCPR